MQRYEAGLLRFGQNEILRRHILPEEDILKQYLMRKAALVVTVLAVTAVRFAKAYVEQKHDDAVNSDNTFKTSVALTLEFITGLGPEVREFNEDHPFTQSLMNSNITTEAFKAFQKGYEGYLAGKRTFPYEYRVDFSYFYPLFGNTGPFKEYVRDGFTAAQFTGTAFYLFEVEGDMLQIMVYDTKTEYSFKYHLPGTKSYSRSENPIMGETIQYYHFSIPLTEVKKRASGKK